MNDSTTARLEAATTAWGYFEDVGNAHAFAREIDPDAWELGDKADFATLFSVTRSKEEAELLVTQFYCLAGAWYVSIIKSLRARIRFAH